MLCFTRIFQKHERKPHRISYFFFFFMFSLFVRHIYIYIYYADVEFILFFFSLSLTLSPAPSTLHVELTKTVHRDDPRNVIIKVRFDDTSVPGNDNYYNSTAVGVFLPLSYCYDICTSGRKKKHLSGLYCYCTCGNLSRPTHGSRTNVLFHGVKIYLNAKTIRFIKRCSETYEYIYIRIARDRRKVSQTGSRRCAREPVVRRVSFFHVFLPCDATDETTETKRTTFIKNIEKNHVFVDYKSD